MTTKTRSRKPAEQKDNNTGHALPEVTFDAPAPDKLAAVSATLKRNLESIPMISWEEPILQALRSAFILGQAASMAEGEDHALDNAPAEEDKGYEFIAAMSRHFDSIAEGLGISAKDVTFKWRVITIAPGENAVALFPTLPMKTAQSLLGS